MESIQVAIYVLINLINQQLVSLALCVKPLLSEMQNCKITKIKQNES